MRGRETGARQRAVRGPDAGTPIGDREQVGAGQETGAQQRKPSRAVRGHETGAQQSGERTSQRLVPTNGGGKMRWGQRTLHRRRQDALGTPM